MDPTSVTINWTADLSVDVPALDDDHKILVNLLNSTLVACYAGFGDEHINIILDELLGYTRTHFAREIDILAQSGYPGCAAHQREHERMLAEVTAMTMRARIEVEQGLSAEVGDFLKTWLTDHILGHDMAYAKFLKAVPAASTVPL
ncbi:MAG TPA: bacteriohemerythrin [Patescibacteria group bacterium]|nr:bacteriohemerythrin [Patescibacteria group bacterium]